MKIENQEDALFQIQRLQFTDRQAASRKLIELFQGSLPFKIASAEVVPRAVSLNSISGSLVSDNGETFFFKTHVEAHSILQEYYNVTALQNAGYPIITPLFVEDTPGKQIVIYPFIRSRTVFDLLVEAEAGTFDPTALMQAQVMSDQQLLEIYSRTLQKDEAQSESPVHQLFYHRLAGRRFVDFYENARFEVGHHEMSFAELAKYKWVINGIAYQRCLSELIEQALLLLHPGATWGDTIVGHGDAHNGNLFFDQQQNELAYFDPAFAGRHSPFLDLVKPLFHNVYATWMYHPKTVAITLDLRCEVSEGTIYLNHNYEPSELRREILTSKLKHVLWPMLANVAGYGHRKDEVVSKMRSALMCCPLLTVNLADRAKYSVEIALLGLSQCIEIASPAIRNEGRFDFLFGGSDRLSAAES